MLVVGVLGDAGIVRFVSWLDVGGLSEILNLLEEDEEAEGYELSWLDDGALSEKLNSLEVEEDKEEDEHPSSAVGVLSERPNLALLVVGWTFEPVSTSYQKLDSFKEKAVSSANVGNSGFVPKLSVRSIF